MKFQFDPNQGFQIEAVNSIVGIFEGQERNTASRIVKGGGMFGIYPNYLTLSKEEVLANVKKIQGENKIANGGAVEEMDFSVEMETGTGKTYVYLRTIFELNKRYGWKKFIVLVPSVAIREGVMKTLAITKAHFSELYGNVPCRFYEYRSKNITQVKHFADSSNINVMVMTVGAFNKDANVLYGARDQMQGEPPITYIQKTNPILILDEPQNMEGEATKEKLKQFNSLFRLRYSATHRNAYNLMYQLMPFDAYRLGLVKKIEVYSVTDDEDGTTKPYLNLITVKPGKTIKAKVEAMVCDKQGNIKKKAVMLGQGDNLALKANNSVYEGYIVQSLNADAPDFGSVGKIGFQNGVDVTHQDNPASNWEAIIRKQISQTIKLHFQRRAELAKIGVKILSLFFIDRVDNYVQPNGIIRKLFVEEFNRLKEKHNLGNLEVGNAHKGYFAKRGEHYLEKERAIAENKEAYELIMKDKERLLSFGEPTEFIFSHSALKEGWDNPNIFNICTLNLTVSTMKKRQEIGRGMRLCVNQNGERIFAKNINLLSVVANESYAEYVAQLQSEFTEDGIYQAVIPGNAKRKVTVRLKEDFAKDDNFSAIWEKISKKTRFIVNINRERLVNACAQGIGSLVIEKPQIRVDRVGLDIGQKEIGKTILGTDSAAAAQNRRIVDCIDFIQSQTLLTRQTVAVILEKSGNFTAFLNNPERFVYEAVKIIKNEIAKAYIEQIAYEVIPERYETKQFEEISGYKDSVQRVERSIYDAIVYESEVEKKFAVDLDKDERIKLFIKLPGWFKIDTPMGSYNPDWAIVSVKRDLQGNESEKLYFVIETKGNINNLRANEQAKIASAKKHFEVVQVNYREVENYQQFSGILH
ncbi:MAG: DEAD/DEAH box helicase family protein [Endomicrobiaceae bacterium]|jgi:type III restriction enzyme|nr:DEAD/DEAH box helicase family protein [Endomicrobiaceae bacterium]